MKFDAHYLWSAKYAKWIILSLIILFSFLILFEIASVFYVLEDTASTSLADPLVSDSSNNEYYEVILETPIFGKYQDETHIKKSMLNVILVGIMYAEPVEASQVIIRSDSGDERVYKVGDSLPGGVILKRILTDGILVDRSGVLESINLPKDSLHFEPVLKPLKEE